MKIPHKNTVSIKISPVTGKHFTVCGAKSRSGIPCQSRPVNGKNRCRMHGGNNPGQPKGCKNARKYGIYEAGLTDAEKETYFEIPLGNLDHEIRVIKIQLARALKAQQESTSKSFVQKDTKTVSETRTDNTLEREEKTRREPDFARIINSFTGRITSLENTRAAILSEGVTDDVDWNQVGKEFAKHAAGISANGRPPRKRKDADS